ncbi:MAG: hypothetical protein ABSF90_19465, partial [Syntrophobacteraceae bacterium]
FCEGAPSLRSGPGLILQPLVNASSPGTEPSLRFGFALYTVEARLMLDPHYVQVRATRCNR